MVKINDLSADFTVCSRTLGDVGPAEDDGAVPRADRYLVLLRRELVRAQARLKRAERERDAALAENARLKSLIKRTRSRRSPPT